MATTTPNYTIDYDDERFATVESDKNQAISDMESTYDTAIGETDKYYNDLQQETQAWADKQTEIQNEQTEFAIEKIEQQKDQTKSDYLKEQAGAYVDWQKQSAQHGVNAEKTAAAGLTNTGYSESSQVSMYNTYQNRVATARESYNNAIVNYDMAIKDARLQNNANLAQIAHDALQQQLELALQGFQYKNNLLLEKANQKIELENIYYQRWQDVLSQMNTENQFAESIRQYEQTYAENVRQFNEEQERLKYEFEQGHKNQLELLAQQYEYDVKMENIRYENDLKLIKEEDKLERERAKEEHERNLEKLAKQHEYDKALIEKEYEEQKKYQTWANSQKTTSITKTSGSGGSSSSKSSGSSSSGAYIQNDDKHSSYEVNTPYYQGNKNPDCAKFGTFSNGYQPKGISGHGKLTNSGKTMQLSTQTRDGHKGTLVQTVWKAADGTYWYWEGRQNKYIQLSSGEGGGGRSFRGGR